MGRTIAELRARYGKVTVIDKRIRGHVYRYGVVWDRRLKKQVWHYIGRVTRTGSCVRMRAAALEPEDLKALHSLKAWLRRSRNRAQYRALCRLLGESPEL